MASKKRRTRRQFESTGVLVLGRSRSWRSKTAWRLLFTRRGLVVWALLAIVACALWLTLDDCFYVDSVKVVGGTRLSPDEVLRVSSLPGLHFLWVRPAEIEERIVTALPSLESANVVCKLWPTTCTISVVERKPRVMWEEEGNSWWIDAEGVIFSVDDSSEEMGQEGLSEAWVVRGPLPKGEDGRLDERVRVALSELWESGENVAMSFYYVPGRGLMFIDEHGWRVIVGQGPGMEKRLQVLELLTADLEERGLTPKFVDVRFADAPYYSLTNEW